MEGFKSPDLNAPRKRKKNLNLLDYKFYSEFKKRNPEYKHLDNAVIKGVIRSFNEEIYNNVIENRSGVELPENLGIIFIGSCDKPNRANVDYDKSSKYGVKVNHRNWDSDDLLMKIFYTNYNTRYLFRFRKLWQFKPHRDFSRKASSVYREDFNKYARIDSGIPVSSLFKKTEIKTIKDYGDHNRGNNIKSP